jgi:hypothetical protein
VWALIGPLYPMSAMGPYSDGDFIAHARTDLPAALDEIEALRAERDAARASGVRFGAVMLRAQAAGPLTRGAGILLTAADDLDKAANAIADKPSAGERITAILAMLDAEDGDLGRHLAEKARALA